MDWQDISTAPAVGKKRLLFWTKRGVVIGYRVAGKKAVRANDHGCIPATHWMPLPPPPTEDTE